MECFKVKIEKEVNETVTNCDQLKLKAQDGKYRSTDAVAIEKNLGGSVVSNKNVLSYKYIEKDLLIENK